jgi:hypothetical protein
MHPYSTNLYNISYLLYIYIYTSELMIRVELLESNLIRDEPSLYKYVSFNIRAD